MDILIAFWVNVITNVITNVICYYIIQWLESINNNN